MSRHKRKHKRRKGNRNDFYTYEYNYENYNFNNNEFNNNEFNNINISEEDLFSLGLLYTQHIADSFVIIADLLSYISTIEGINFIYSKYNNTSDRVPNPNIPALQSAYIIFFVSLVYANLAFTKYEHLVERKENGEIDYSLQPNIDINYANIFGVIRYSFLLSGVLGIYERDLNQPIVGI